MCLIIAINYYLEHHPFKPHINLILSMKAKLIICSFLSAVLTASASVVVPGANGSSGVLNITENTTIDLSLAATGQWDDAGNSPNGIYDPDKWAVVFNYSNVTIAAGATLTFENHPSRAPVVWLVSGDVIVDGTVNLDGEDWQTAPDLSEPGPGGFRGGSATYLSGPVAGAGFGPGGGFYNSNSNAGLAAGYGTEGYTNGPTYGNASLIPLIGGSGGSGDPGFTGVRRGGGAGGGALLIAATGNCTLNGAISSRGGNGVDDFAGTDAETGGGSGGGIRIVCDQLFGSGSLSATGGGGWDAGGLGRIRLERSQYTGSIQITPGPSVIPLSAGDTAILWPPSTAPQVRVVSIGGETAPADPRAAFGAFGADVVLPETNTTQIVIETTNVEQASSVEVRMTPRAGANASRIAASVDSVVTTDPLVVRWVADLPANVGYSAVQVHVVRP